MIEFLQFAVLGIGVGVAYVLLANGLIVIYRGSGVLNFAQGAYAMAAAFTFYELHVNDGWSFAWAFTVTVLMTAAIGAVTHLAIMRRLRHASALTRLIATLGILGLMEGIATLFYGSNVVTVPSSLPTSSFIVHGVFVPVNSIWLLGLGIVLTFALSFVSRHTMIGLATSAVAENQRAASALGWSPDLMATLNWSLGAALAAVAGVLIAPLSGITVTNLTLIVVAAMAAALIGKFSSYWLTLLAGLGIGILQSELASYSQIPGLIDAAPFFLIIAVLVLTGRALPVRGDVLDRLPMIGTTVMRAEVILPAAAIFALCLFIFPQALTIAITTQLVIAVVLLSMVVVTGFAGQLSLAQFALAGIGAFIAGRLVAAQHWPFIGALPAGVVGAAIVGVVLGLPALRTRGVNLAVATLGLGLALQEMLFQNANYTGGASGTYVGAASLFGFSIDPVVYPVRWGVFCLVLFVASAFVVMNLRRGRAGRRFIAVRANERAAASLGISVAGAKLAAFAIAAGLAGLSGILLGFSYHTIDFTQYDALTSINSVIWITIGGIGFVTGSMWGSFFVVGGVGSFVLDRFGSLSEWLGIIGGASVLLVLLLNPDGIAGAIAEDRTDPVTKFVAHGVRRLNRAIASRRRRTQLGVAPADAPGARPQRVRPAVLDVRGLRVTYGGVVAVDGVDLTVHPGEVVGLVGPNGAGKTTLVDAVSGFVPAAEGSVKLGDTVLDRMNATRRARMGMTRSFQSVELFTDLSVLENLQAASDARDTAAYVTNLVRPGRPRLPATAATAVRTFKIEDALDQKPDTLSYARRRIVAIARAAATEPSILLLDEPAAGLDKTETRELSDFVRHLADEWGVGILLIEHDMEMVMNLCDRVVVLEFGRKIADGTASAVRSDPQVIAAYLGQDDRAPAEVAETVHATGS